MSEKKEYSRSIRMTNTVKEFVELQEGKGFNEKFENMVLFCKKNMPDLEKKIEEKELELQEKIKKIQKYQSLLIDLERTQKELESVFNSINRISRART